MQMEYCNQVLKMDEMEGQDRELAQ